MTTAQELISHAKRCMAKSDVQSAHAALTAVVLTELSPLDAVRALIHLSRCSKALGDELSPISHHRTGLNLLINSGLLQPASINLELARTALLLAVGAHDADAVRVYLSMLLGESPSSVETFKISPLVKIPSWCKARNIPVQELDPTEEIVIHDNLGISRSLKYKSVQTWHAVIPNAEIIFGWDFAIAPSGEVLEGANYLPVEITFPFMPHAHNPHIGLVAHPWTIQGTYIDDDALFLSTPEQHHYGHWISDFLPRLRVWKEQSPKRKLVISAELPTKHRELLRSFDVKSDDLLECHLGQRYKFRSLQVVRTGKSSAPNLHNARFLYEGFRPSGSNVQKGQGKRLFLVRDAGTRMLANQNEMDSLFQEFGIDKVNPAKLSYDQQKALMAEADVIIGAFGTELYCLYNMRPGSTVIELIWDAEHATVYGPICSFLGINHHLMVCESSERSALVQRKIDRDIIVNCGELRQRLNAIASI